MKSDPLAARYCFVIAEDLAPELGPFLQRCEAGHRRRKHDAGQIAVEFQGSEDALLFMVLYEPEILDAFRVVDPAEEQARRVA